MCDRTSRLHYLSETGWGSFVAVGQLPVAGSLVGVGGRGGREGTSAHSRHVVFNPEDKDAVGLPIYTAESIMIVLYSR